MNAKRNRGGIGRLVAAALLAAINFTLVLGGCLFWFQFLLARHPGNSFILNLGPTIVLIALAWPIYMTIAAVDMRRQRTEKANKESSTTEQNKD